MTVARSSQHAIAIVGIGCRFPGGVSNPRQLFDFLAGAGDAIREVPADRYSLDLHYDPEDGPDKVYVRHAGFLEQDIFTFDPTPFGISPRDADHMDPQQRLLLEVAWEAFEDAGIAIDRLRGSNTGVFVGGFMLDTQTLALDGDNRALVSQYTSTGVTMTVLANRISHTFDLRGPSLTVDTACSASLVATDLACRSLAEGTCDVALAGGATVILTNGGTLIMCKGRFLAPDGRSKAFEASADGYGRGEGAGVVVLKRLEDALRDGDRVYAVIRGTGTNQDGRTDGMAFPNGEAQASLSAQVCQRAGIAPTDVAYIEAHGTGTRAGDPIEVRALASTYGGDRAHPLLIGSIKTNIGHLEAGAGVAGLIKVATAIARKTLLPQRKLVQPNPEIPFDALGVRVVQEPMAWPAPARRIAGINSFGYGGTNAHVIVSDLDSALHDLGLAAREPSVPASPSPFVAVSADSDAALRAHARQLGAFVQGHPELSLGDLAHTLAVHRSHRALRAVAIADDRDTLCAALHALATGEAHPRLVTGRAASKRRVLWVFTGMGPQWWGMAHDLYEHDDAFRASVDAADRAFFRVARWSILEEMLRDEVTSRMTRNEVAQPANLVLQIGLVASLRARGVRADGYLGHSVGELGAAYASGCLDLEQTMHASYYRSQLQQTMAGRGTMLAAAVTPARANELIAGLPLEIAAYNAATSVALAGDRAALEQVARQLAADGVFHRLMPVEVAYHSHHMDPLEQKLREQLAFLTPRAPAAPLYSTVTGALVDGAIHDAGYWWQNARKPVLLHRAVTAALADEHSLFIEIGPQPVLKMALGETIRERGGDGVTLHALHRKIAGSIRLRELVAEVHVHGGEVELAAADDDRPIVEVPSYPFDRQHHWVEAESSRARRLGREGAHPILQRREPGPLPRFTSDLSTWGLRWIRDHQVDGRPVFPGAGYGEALLALAAERYGTDGELVISDLVLEQPLVLVDDTPTTLRLEVDDAGLACIMSSYAPAQWTVHARARLHERSRFAPAPVLDADDVRARLALGPSHAELYERFEALGLRYAGAFRCIERVWCREGEVLAELRLPEVQGYRLHPAVLDGALQALLCAQRETPTGPFVPVSIERLRWLAALHGPSVLAHGRVRHRGDGSLIGDVTLCDLDGRVVAEARGVECRAVRPIAHDLTRDEHTWFHGEAWRPVDQTASTPRGSWLIVGEDVNLARGLVAELGRTIEVRRLDPLAPWPRDLVPTRVVLLAPTGEPRDSLRALADVVQRAITLAEPPQLTVVTCGAFDTPSTRDIDPGQTAVVGMARVAMTEHPQLAVRVVDLAAPEATDATRIATCIAGAVEEELVLTPAELLARRIVRTGAVNQARRDVRVECAATAAAAELVVTTPGMLDTLTFRPVPERPLADDEVEVEVEVASLNFKDVMKAMGMLSRTALERTYLGDGLGMEAVGRVVRIGGAVTHVRTGERVYLWRGGCLATRVRARGAFVFAVGETVDSEEASCRFVFLTAWHGLVDVARIGRGDRVLIHSAAGGVGLAAIQIAQRLGAEIFATAGTEDKRAYLRTLGVEHVYDSRTLDFADEIRRDTGGQGVDVVLNALAGPAQRLSLELLRDGGRFVEIGKQDIAGGTQLSLLPFNRALSFTAVDLDRLSSSRIELCGRLAREVWTAFEQQALRALPTEVFPVARIADAFRRLASGQLIGKVAVDFRGQTITVAPGLTPATTIRRDATYLVTGGLGGLGLRTAQWLAEQGATHLVLASRRGAPTEDDAETIAALRARGTSVICLALDVTDEAAVRDAIQAIDRVESPLGGVFHSAMVLDDGPLATLVPEALDRVCGPKITGALNLHRATCDLPLDHFVMFSSVSALVGNPGQAAYAAANAFLDGLAAHRRRLGLPAMAVAWGALAETGVVARNDEVRRHLASMGLRPLVPARALLALRRALEEAHGQVGIIDIDWSRWRKATAPTPWHRLDEISETAAGADAKGTSLAAELVALDPAARRARVEEKIMAAVALVLRLSGDRLDPQRPLKDYGIDSLMAVELQVALVQATGVELSTMELLAGRNLRSLSERVLAALVADERASIGGRTADAAGTSAAELAVVPNIDDIPSANDSAALRAYFLDRICVQAPYFALEQMRLDGEWVRARAIPVPAPDAEAGAIGIAEAARHLAILGSCAVRRQTKQAGRIYYPVRRTVLSEVSSAATPRVAEAHMRARCVRLDELRSEATAIAELVDVDGTPLASFEIGYHIIPEAQFQALFAAHARPTDEASGHDPYNAVHALSEMHADGDALVAELGPIDPRRCLGHFVGYPAYPVSIMARDAVQLVAEALRRRSLNRELRVRVVGGAAGTARFIFAGESATMVARPILTRTERERTGERWRVEITTGGELAAWFDMELALVQDTALGALFRKLERADAEPSNSSTF
ncbi:MAG: SDR family NAD(P)-dependent oxidoreductase [Kofleriaceae bacterium]|nr:SDR family NAD(P)-dependent oxidoreductase [Kofleriaceae bacterium]